MQDQIGEFSLPLVAWYARSKRDLPWRRRSHDPYAIWVSEIMLQQTTVAAAIPFYERWMERFPTVQALASAPLDDVLKHWAGLGYYARARNLHRGAQTVVEKFGGQIPSDPKEILALPGIGRYTAGAILSIAFEQNEPILDANVMRVLSRVFLVPGDPKTSRDTQTELWRLALALIPSGRASDFNQAMMELGALVCSTKAPACHSCPVNSVCQARAMGDPTAYPQFSGEKKWRSAEDVSVAIRDTHGRILIVQRPIESSLWGGLWELPRVTRLPDEAAVQCAARAACEIVGITLGAMTQFGTVKHIVANRRITLFGYESTLLASEAPRAIACARVEWVTFGELDNYAFSTPQVKLLAQLKTSDTQPSFAFPE